ncbi:sterol O-acyltransferase 1-like isoform X2 [Rhopilema esculentum]|uniref:sterol O-acyltransferase 1-like isoform X2 n=1 Tax=Rhopilema esculentum TaxID=499914 RepID=UPI0031E47DD7
MDESVNNSNGYRDFLDETSGAHAARVFRKKADELQNELLGKFDAEFHEIIDQCADELEEPTLKSKKHTNLYDAEGRKVFIARESLLTELLEINHIQTIYNIFVALLILFIMNTLVYDYIETGRFGVDFSLILWAFGKVPVVVTTWLMMMMYTFTIFPLMQAWIFNQKSWIPLPDLMWIMCYGIYMLFFAYFPVVEIIKHDVPTVSTIIVLCEQVRLMMKVHAFARENFTKVLKIRNEEDSEKKEAQFDNMPGFSQFLYFLFAPTLIYRDSYPMTPQIRWEYVVTNVLQVIVCVFFTYYVFARFCVPVFRNTGKDQGHLRELLLATFSCMLPGTLVLILGFFSILHSWLNAFAEMLRFADRMFYRDWWNSFSYAAYYRMWNVVVHDWLFAYIYKDTLLLFGEDKKALAAILVFVLSAIAHEYILILAFGFFFPLLFFMFGGVGFLFSLIGPKKGAGQPHSAWNIFMWVSLILGNGLLMCLYSQEWYASKNCPRDMSKISEVLIPRSWSSDCVKWSWDVDKRLPASPLLKSR